jgi:hypothetical protein
MTTKLQASLLGFVGALCFATAGAVDGVTLINQATVIAAGGFPYIINNPGSYRLSSNLRVPSGASGILTATSAVTLDLNGFAITALPPTCAPGVVCSVVAYGISQSGGADSFIAVRNGSILGFAYGVYYTGCTSCSFQHLMISTTQYGILATGDNLLISGNVVQGPTGTAAGVQGINAQVGYSQGGALISGNVVLGEFPSGGIAALCPANLIGNMVGGSAPFNFYGTVSTCIRYNNNPAP